MAHEIINGVEQTIQDSYNVLSPAFRFTTTGSTLKANILTPGQNVRWVLGNGTTIIGKNTGNINFGSSTLRVHRLYVDDWSLVASMNFSLQSTLAFDISQLSLLGLTNIVTIEVNNTLVEGSVSDFAEFTTLNTLAFSGCQITGDIGGLSPLTSLTYISGDNNTLSGDIGVFANMPNLGVLRFDTTSVSGNISGLASLTSLTSLQLNNTSVSGDLSALAPLTSLATLRLYTSSVSNYTQGTLPNWDACNISIQNLGLSQQEVDDFLADLDAVSVASTKALNIGGSNAIPSAAGLASAASLTGKGWTVTVAS